MHTIQPSFAPARPLFIGVIFGRSAGRRGFCHWRTVGPIFLEYHAIGKAAAKAAKGGSTVPDPRQFRSGCSHRRHFVDPGQDLEVTKRGDKIIVSFKYSREIALAGPAYLVYRFEDSTK